MAKRELQQNTDMFRKAARTTRPFVVSYRSRPFLAARARAPERLVPQLSCPSRNCPPSNAGLLAASAVKRISVARAAMADAPAAELETNPLLTDSPFPNFNAVAAEHVVPGIRGLLTECGKDIDSLEGSVTPAWEGLAEPLERIVDRLSRAWGTVSHLKAVKDSEDLRKAYEEVQPERVKLLQRLSQSRALYEAFKQIREGPSWESLSEAQKRIVESELRDFVLGGVALEGEQKERFNTLQQDLSKLSTKFSNNVLDSTKAFKKLVSAKEELDGVPPSALALFAQQAKAEGHESATAEDGPWLLTLDIPAFLPIARHAKNRTLREELYRKYITVASSGDSDNEPIIEKILELRQEKAELLGLPNHAEVSMASKMATLEKANALLGELRTASYKAALKDHDELKAFAREQGFSEELQQWDLTFWAERLREAKYDISDEQLRPYFSLPNVLDGLFKLAGKLFGVTVEAADGQAPVWHPDVRFFKVFLDGKPKAYFYLDPYSRPAEKRGGAWMDEVCGQSKLFAADGEDLRLPVAHMVCNQTPPIGEQPSLMTFREVETLFHECGHALQHMLTQQSEGLAAGIRGVEWDAVELPSQFMENWCYHRPTLDSFARHFETGEALPEDLYQKLVAAKNFRSGSMTLRQVYFATLDLKLHSRYQAGRGGSVFASPIVKQVIDENTVVPPLLEDRFLNAFQHIFAGGYSAGYYSYKWAEVLSADAFSAFEEVGLDNEAKVAETGRRFRSTVLALGGGRAPDLVFKDFRGREPSSEPLLRHNALLPATA